MWKHVKKNMANNDMFKYELPFEMTKKGNRGSSMGFCLSMVYMIVLWYYIISQFALFFTFKADSYEEYIFPIDFDEMGTKKFEEF